MEKQNNLVFIIAAWMRYDVTEICFKNLSKQKDKYGFEVIVAGSEKKIKGLTDKYGFDYIEHSNAWLSDKNNALTLEAKKYNPRGVVILGSDDLINNEVIEKYYDLIEQDYRGVFGFEDLYFIDTYSMLLSHFNCGTKSYGAGRFYSYHSLNKCKWKAWRGQLNKGLDNNSAEYLKSKGVKFDTCKLSDIKGMLLDIKHKVNISSRDIVKAGEKVDLRTLHKHGLRIKTALNDLHDQWAKEEKEKREYMEKLEAEMKLPEDMAAICTIEGTGLSPHMPKGAKYKVYGFQAKRLILMKRAKLC